MKYSATIGRHRTDLCEPCLVWLWNGAEIGSHFLVCLFLAGTPQSCGVEVQQTYNTFGMIMMSDLDSGAGLVHVAIVNVMSACSQLELSGVRSSPGP